MSRPRILVVGGGPSLEREISLISSKAVYEALKENDHDVFFYDWDGTTEWLKEHAQEYSVVLPILHGRGGEDGELQSLLEELDVSFLGSGSGVSRLCFNKAQTLKKLKAMGILIPRGGTVTRQQYPSHALAQGPHVLKPFNGGSSIDTFILPDPLQAPKEQIDKSFKKYKHMLIEEYLDGVEVTVPVLNNQALEVIEIKPPKNGVFDYANKYNGATKELCPPVSITENLQEELKALALKIHTSFGCRHLTRIDMIIVNNQPYVLEVNTLPGMTSQSLYPKSAAVSGILFPELVDMFVELCLKERGQA